MHSFPTRAWVFVMLLLFVPSATAQRSEKDLAATQENMSRVVSALSADVAQLEILQNRLMDLGRANENYDEQKNIWMSSVLTLSAIQSICEYQSELLTLFMELKENRRKHFYDVRIESLVSSIQQINIMQKQNKISHSLIMHENTERIILEKENKVIQSVLLLLKQSRDLITTMKKN